MVLITPKKTLYDTIQAELNNTKETSKPYTLSFFPPTKKQQTGSTDVRVDVRTQKNIKNNLITKLKLSILDEHKELDVPTNERVQTAIEAFGQEYYLDIKYHTHLDFGMPSKGFSYHHFDDEEFFIQPDKPFIQHPQTSQEQNDYIDEQLLLKRIYLFNKELLPPKKARKFTNLYAAPLISSETTKRLYETLLTIAPHFEIDTKGMYKQKEFRITKQTTPPQKHRVDQIVTLQPNTPSKYSFWGGVKQKDVDNLETYLNKQSLMDRNEEWVVEQNHAKDF